MKQAVIYKYTNKINGKIYIGKTINVERRKKEHLKDRRVDVPFHRAIDKYGIENFDFEVIFVADSTLKNTELNYVLNEKESYYISYYNSNNKKFGYNLTSGGDGVAGYVYTEQARRNLSLSKMGENNPNWGKSASVETRKKMSEVRKGHRPYNNKIILQYDLQGNFIKEWESALKAAESFGKYNQRSNITKACKENRIALGYRWKYKDNVINKSDDGNKEITE